MAKYPVKRNPSFVRASELANSGSKKEQGEAVLIGSRGICEAGCTLNKVEHGSSQRGIESMWIYSPLKYTNFQRDEYPYSNDMCSRTGVLSGNVRCL
jgi:hypothetical protein